MEYLDIVNKVLIRLREDEVSSVAQTNYSTLIGEFVNEAKREVESLWDWSRLRTNLTISTSSGDSTYTLTGAGERARILSVLNTTENNGFLRKCSRDYAKNFMAYTPTPDTGTPTYYYVEGATGGDPDFTVIPVPDSTYDLDFHCIVPQSELENDDDEITIPWFPVMMGAYAKAVAERGEDGGTSAQAAFSSYNSSVTQAINIDAIMFEDELDWYV